MEFSYQNFTMGMELIQQCHVDIQPGDFDAGRNLATTLSLLATPLPEGSARQGSLELIKGQLTKGNRHMPNDVIITAWWLV